jgi:hypothetical protein
MSRSQFRAALFELVDVWTPALSAAAYIEFCRYVQMCFSSSLVSLLFRAALFELLEFSRYVQLVLSVVLLCFVCLCFVLCRVIRTSRRVDTSAVLLTAAYIEFCRYVPVFFSLIYVLSFRFCVVLQAQFKSQSHTFSNSFVVSPCVARRATRR